MEGEEKWGGDKKDRDFRNIATWNVRSLVEKENEVVEEFEKENLDTLEIGETRKKSLGELEVDMWRSEWGQQSKGRSKT